MKRFLSFFALWLCSLSAPLRAQSDTQLLFTTGTSSVGTDGQRWIYIVWDSADPAIMAGRCFSVNFRPGTAEDSGNYTCEVRGPLSVSLATVTHKLFVRGMPHFEFSLTLTIIHTHTNALSPNITLVCITCQVANKNRTK